jgi:hypothetical protein
MHSTLKSIMKKISLLIFLNVVLSSCINKQTQYFIFTVPNRQVDGGKYDWKFYKTNLYDPSHIEEIKITPCTLENPFPDWSPNGKYYGCSATDNQPLRIYDNHNNITAELGPGNPDASSQWTILEWSPDSQYVSLLNTVSKEKSHYQFSIMKYDGTGFLQLNEQSNGTINQGEWSPNGKLIAHQTYTKDHAYLIIFQPTGKEVSRIDLSEFISTPVIMYADAPRVLANQIKWSSDSKKMALTIYSSIWIDSQLYIWDIESGKINQVILNPSVCITRIADWSPNGEKLLLEAHTCKDVYEYGYVYYSMNADGTNLKQLTEKGYDSLRWTPDGKSGIVDRDGVIYLADVDGNNRKEIVDNGIFVDWITP